MKIFQVIKRRLLKDQSSSPAISPAQGPVQPALGDPASAGGLD